MKKLPLFLLLFCTLHTLHALTLGSKDTADSKLNFWQRTTLGSYGNAFYQNDFHTGTSTANLERFVIFVGHKFNKHISFLSELEVEDAKISGDGEGGEIALEQCYLKFNINPNHSISAGLFIPQIGILNEHHLPTEYFGNERNRIETLIIPATWRELGINYHGVSNRAPLNWSVSLVNGLNSAAFEHGNLFRAGRFEGQNASANNLALMGALQLQKSKFTAQISGYFGGSVGLSKKQADSLKLSSGYFGTPLALGEIDLAYSSNGVSIRALGTVAAIPNAFEVNRAYASNTPDLAYGAYAEAAYNVFYESEKLKKQELNIFLRYEKLNLNAKIPVNGITDGTLNQNHIVTGVSYLPIPNVVVKADLRFSHTGPENPTLVINPGPVAIPFSQNTSFLNLGIGYSF